MKQDHPGEFRYKTIGRYWAYHGTTLGTLAAGGMGERKAKFQPLGGNDFVHTAPPYCYRCPFGLSYPSCGSLRLAGNRSSRRGREPGRDADSQ